ncbi:TetR/AcrR family transcriptional regulator [Sphingosinicella sp. LHD-64]|uniref:TetR/AcrR family transcriptional regulator n=1 Tax=Sphingosinicella sp. LHD-64 TaxID=3072139 RepID=UPI00280C429C|nr:TetR/AcrR family transcriptional regulator [Sphingosinicella sp. LHD-64]MDQ8758367.1 TetR/AcrR family transcriptional regulator [Sphingosinicella sp. LHD-64]
MPKQVDVDEQKRVLFDAVWRLVAREGLEGVSLRTVAAEAGVSMGRVQHYFASKDDLLIYSLQRAYDRMETRILDRLKGREEDEQAALLAILDELLGENAETRDAIRVNVAFAARGQSDPRIMAVVTEGDREIHELAVAVIAAAHAGEAGVDADLEARLLMALASGLGIGVALYGASSVLARQTLDRHLQRVLPGVRI